MSLTGKQRRYLRGLGHALDPTVHMGKEGITDGLIGALDAALGTHELIKVRLAKSVDLPREEVAALMAEGSGAEAVQVLGLTILLYRPHPEEPKIVLP